MDQNVAQHDIFSPALDAAWLYIRSVRANLSPRQASPVPEPPADLVASVDLSKFNLDPTKPFSSKTLRTHIDSFVMPLIEHLGAEIGTLTPEFFQLVGDDGQEGQGYDDGEF